MALMEASSSSKLSAKERFLVGITGRVIERETGECLVTALFAYVAAESEHDTKKMSPVSSPSAALLQDFQDTLLMVASRWSLNVISRVCYL